MMCKQILAVVVVVVVVVVVDVCMPVICQAYPTGQLERGVLLCVLGTCFFSAACCL
jgi:hypothetical protein